MSDVIVEFPGVVPDEPISEVHSVFDQPWWLEAVAPGSWGAVTVRDDRGVAARLPFVRKRRGPLTILTQPPMTQTLGPWIRPSDKREAERLGDEKDLMGALIDGLPKHDYFLQHFSPEVTNWLPFYWKGFSATVRYTYELPDLSDEELVWKGLRKKTREAVRRAAKKVEVARDTRVEDFLRLHALTFERQGLDPPFGDAEIVRLMEACRERDAGRLYVAVDEDERVHAAEFIVWGERRAYFLLGAADPDLRRSGATTMLMWEAIRELREEVDAMDFEGSMIESIERFFRTFGTVQRPFLVVSRAGGRMAPLLAAKDLGRAAGGALQGPAEQLRSRVKSMRDRTTS